MTKRLFILLLVLVTVLTLAAPAALAANLATPKIKSVTASGKAVTVTWDKVDGAEAYRLFYMKNGKWAKLKDTTGTSLTLNGTYGKTYTYTVRCITADGAKYTSSYDKTGKSITLTNSKLATPKISSVTANGKAVTVKWGAVEGAASYRLFYMKNGKWAKLADTTDTSVTKNGSYGKTYTYTVRCITKDGKSYTSGYDKTGKSITLTNEQLATPKLTSVSKEISGVKISWGKVTGAQNYRVFYRTSDGSWKRLADTSGTSYTWKAAKKGVSYSFTVRCISADGEVYTSDYDPVGLGMVVPMKELSRYQYFKKYMDDQQFQQAYDAAVQIVTPLVGLSREDQLMGIATELRALYDAGMTYSMSEPHYNDPYGYLILKTASCAGCTRTTGLCLDMLGIEYEHVQEHEYSHQWARVKVGNEYWICDAYGLYCGPEPGVRQHPYLQ